MSENVPTADRCKCLCHSLPTTYDRAAHSNGCCTFVPRTSAPSSKKEQDGLADAWPIVNVLGCLIDAVDHLLHDHDCDRHGYEVVAAARDAARAHVNAFTRAQTRAVDVEAEARKMEQALWGAASAPGARRCHECGQLTESSVEVIASELRRILGKEGV